MTIERNTTGAVDCKVQASDVGESEFESAIDCAADENAAMARRFLRLAKFDGGAFERLNRYETAAVIHVELPASAAPATACAPLERKGPIPARWAMLNNAA
jgi:hypothetical protein